jgi:hypothetical protein
MDERVPTNVSEIRASYATLMKIILYFYIYFIDHQWPSFGLMFVFGAKAPNGPGNSHD